MKNRVIWFIALILVFAGCRSKQMAAVETPEYERPVIERENNIAVEVEADQRIRSLEESFSFLRDQDRNLHDANPYFVIIGSFRNKDNADRYKETIKEKGFVPVILLSETGYHRVSVDSYLVEADARRRIMQIRTDFPEHADTWLLVRK